MADASTLDDDDVFEMANLSEAWTGIPGVVWISTAVKRHGPRVKYFEKAGADQPSFSVSIAEAPEIVANSLPEPVKKKMSPPVIEWVTLNRTALLEFWNKGDTWMDEQVTAFKDALIRLP